VSRYIPAESQADFPALEHRILDWWAEARIFEQSLEQREGCPDWVFYDGPPGTNGKPHIGHMLQSSLKDLWPRYKTMQGFRVLRKAGWDTHGLPVELKAERELGIEDKSQIPAFGVEKFMEYCRSTVFRFKDDWEQSIRRIGRFLDLREPYATLTNDYIQSDWWVIRQIWDKGLLYRDYRIMPYCARCGTSLSNYEVTEGYKDVVDLTLTARFPVAGRPRTFFLAWTTTPWTLVGNTALALNPELEYAFVEVDGDTLILASALVESVMKGREYRVTSTVQGRELDGWAYEPLWPFFAGPDGEGRVPHHTLMGDFVTAEDGTGIVHLALYGEDDYRMIRRDNLPRIQHVDETGHFGAACGVYAGRYFKAEGLDLEILKDLQSRGLLHDKHRHEHSYPHCYKCENPLMYFARTSWFIRTSALRQEMLAANAEINWYPGYIKDGRFGNWLENNVDWSVSRDRYWGSPLPVWSCTACEHQLCVSGIAELEQVAGEPLPPGMDLHTPWIDQVKVPCPKCGSRMAREPYLLDCWFNAGLMPWGQYGYPATEGSAELLANQFPADFICEGLDQTRGWFYNLLAVSTILTGKSSFRNVICTGLVADKDGRKMSKTFGNVVDPGELFERFGADAVRWTFYNSHPWGQKRYSDELVRDAVKDIIIPYWNIYSFFVTYANIDDWTPGSGPGSGPGGGPAGRSGGDGAELDRWIRSATSRLCTQVETALENFDVYTASIAIRDYIEELSNWYIRRSRARFWKSEDGADKQAAFDTLYHAIRDLTLVLAPFLPFVTETVYQRLIRRAEPGLPESVHLCRWPRPDGGHRDEDLEREMSLVYHAVNLGRSLRSRHNLKTRQPLRKLVLVVGREGDDAFVHRMEGLIREELNVRQVEISRREEDLVHLSVKANFRGLGKAYGKRMPEAAAEIAGWGLRQIETLERGETLEVLGVPVGLDGIVIQREEKEGLVVITEQGFTVALDTELDDELRREGLARELVNRIQTLRKESGLEVTDRIRVCVDGSAAVLAAVAEHRDYICRETWPGSLRPGRGAGR
jgi:isoleucyl-tRNA synthetase